MNYENLFYTLNKLSTQNLIEEKTIIKKQIEDKEINEKKAEERIKKKKIFYIKLSIDPLKNILVKDFSLNFLLSYGLLIGEDTQLLEVRFKDDFKTTIIEKTQYEELKEKIIKIYGEISPKDLYLKKIKIKYELTPLIKELKKYIYNKKKINLDQIHIIKGSGIEIFNPSTKYRHFKLAKNLEIPTIQLIENNFIKKTTIHIFDYNSHIELLKPLFIKEETIPIKYYNNKETYIDISSNYFINFNKKELIKKINNTEKINFDTEKIFYEILRTNQIKLSNQNTKISLPIYKDLDSQTFFTPKTSNSFFELTGLKYRDEIDFLKKTLLFNQRGSEMIFKEKYLDKELNFILSKEDIKSKKIIFTTIKELILKLTIIDNPTEIKEIKNIENIEKSYIRNINKLKETIIKLAINTTKKPKYFIPTSFEEKLFSEITNQSKTVLNNYYKNSINLKEAIIINNKYLIKILKINQFFLFNEKILGHLFEILIIQKNYLREIDTANLNTIEKEIKELFEIRKITYKYQSFPNYSNLLDDLYKTAIISKKKPIEIFIKENSFIELFKNHQIIHKQKNYTLYIKPNSKKIREIFRYSTSKTIKEIKKYILENQKKIINSNQEEKISIKINNKEIKLNKDYLSFFKKIEDGKIIAENDFFITYKIL